MELSQIADDLNGELTHAGFQTSLSPADFQAAVQGDITAGWTPSSSWTTTKPDHGRKSIS